MAGAFFADAFTPAFGAGWPARGGGVLGAAAVVLATFAGAFAFFSGAFFSGAFFSGAFFNGAFFNGAFFNCAFLGVFVAAAFFGATFFGDAFLAAFRGGAFFPAFLAGACFAAAFFGAGFRDGAALRAGAFFAADFFAAAFFAGAFRTDALFRDAPPFAGLFFADLPTVFFMPDLLAFLAFAAMLTSHSLLRSTTLRQALWHLGRGCVSVRGWDGLTWPWPARPPTPLGVAECPTGRHCTPDLYAILTLLPASSREPQKYSAET